MSLYSPREVTDRLRAVGAGSDLTASRRLDTKVDMSRIAVTRRLENQSELRRTCLAFRDLALGRAKRA